MLKTLRPCLSVLRRPLLTRFAALSTAPSTSAQPWFVDQDIISKTKHVPPHFTPGRISVPSIQTLPPDLPEHIANLHSELSRSPLLEPGTLTVSPPLLTAPGPALPLVRPKGRRKRGGTYAGEGVIEPPGGPWRWVVLAQVKEGSEGRGAIEAVVRVVRKSLLTARPPLPLPPNRKRASEDGWVVIDAGDFAVHILSQEARHKYFPVGQIRDWEW